MSTPTSDGPDPDLPPIAEDILQAMAGLPEDFHEFPRIFQDDIRPALQANEFARLKAADRARKATWLGGVVGVVGVLISLFALRVPQLAIFAGIAGAGIVGLGRRPLQSISKQAKSMIVEPIARQLALDFLPAPGYVDSILDHKRVGLVPGWDRSAYEDLVVGNRNGIDFEFFEAHLEDKRTTTDSNGRTQTRWVTVFRGQCIRFDFHKRFFGHTLVTRDAGFFNFMGNMTMGDLERARLESPKFEKAFEVYTSDQVEARFLLTPDLMQRLVELEEAFHGKKLRCAFEGGEMFIAVEGTDLFEPGSMFTPLDNPERTRDLLNDFAVLFHLIDQVSVARKKEEEHRGEPPQA